MSGDALINTHAEEAPSPTMIEDWVRGVTVRAVDPTDLASVQFSQLQFHCGNPPPAAEPSTRIFIGQYEVVVSFFMWPYASSRALSTYSRELAWLERGRDFNRPFPAARLQRSAVEHVHRYLKAKTQVDRLGRFPFHDVYSYGDVGDT